MSETTPIRVAFSREELIDAARIFTRRAVVDWGQDRETSMRDLGLLVHFIDRQFAADGAADGANGAQGEPATGG